MRKNWGITVPKKNANISISFLPTSCLLRRNLLFLLQAKKRTAFRQLINFCMFRKFSVLKPHFFQLQNVTCNLPEETQKPTLDLKLHIQTSLNSLDLCVEIQQIYQYNGFRQSRFFYRIIQHICFLQKAVKKPNKLNYLPTQ